MTNKIYLESLKPCPVCNSKLLYFYSNSGFDLLSNYVTNYFLECSECGTNIRSRDLDKLIEVWNSYAE